MIVPYLPSTAQLPIPSLGGALARWRPIIAIRLGGPTHSWLCDGLLGHAAFLQYFDVEFRGADRDVVITPNRSFSGQRK